MNEEPIQFPRANDKLKEIEIILNYIKLELQKKEITAQLGKDISNKNLTVTTDKEVPEEIKSSIRKYAENYDFIIEFLTV